MELNELRKLAEAATPGPWKVLPPRMTAAITICDRKYRPIVTTCSNTAPETLAMHRSGEVRANAAFIAAANPVAVLSLLDAHAALLAENAELKRRLGAGGQSDQKPFHHYGLCAEEVAQLLKEGLKPEEIGGPDDIQHDRVGELVRWFARFTQGNASPKWAARHACELAYFIATNSINRSIDLEQVRKTAFKEGVNITPEERGTLERIGFATPRPADAEITRLAKALVDAEAVRDGLVGALQAVRKNPGMDFIYRDRLIDAALTAAGVMP